jgi:hypothetical protein
MNGTVWFLSGLPECSFRDLSLRSLLGLLLVLLLVSAVALLLGRLRRKG